MSSQPDFENMLLRELQETRKEVKEIKTKLFIDNNGKSLQSQVNANSRNIKLIMGVFTAVGGAVLSGISWLLFRS